MHHIVYQSTAVASLSMPELLEMLAKSRLKNARIGITGLLLYSEGQILQVLEGEQEAVQALFDKIEVDFRHSHVVKLADGPIKERVFTDWSMGFQALSGADFARVAGYVDPFRSGFLDAHLPHMDEALLHLLKDFVMTDHPPL